MNTFFLDPHWLTLCQSFSDLCDYSSWVACFYQINANPLILKNLRSTINLTKIFPLNNSLIKCGQIKYTKSFLWCPVGEWRKNRLLILLSNPRIWSVMASLRPTQLPSGVGSKSSHNSSLSAPHIFLQCLNVTGCDRQEDKLTRTWTRKPR